MKHIYLLVALAIFSLSSIAQMASTLAITFSAPPHLNCSTTTATVLSQINCNNAVHTGNTVTITGSTVTIDINYTIGPICLGALAFPTHIVPLSGLPVGNINVVVNHTWNGPVVSTTTTQLTVGACCPSQANAGNDTSMCDVSQLTLNANTVPSFASGNWTVASGSATFSNPTNPNAIASNLTYGVNRLVWTTVDTVCTTSDTVSVVYSQIPTTPVTEANRFSCYDTTTITANAITIGNGSWKSLTPGVNIVSKTNPISKVLSLSKSTNILTWTATNGACKATDTLKLNHSVIITPPTISANGLILTSSSAPAYQWYLDGNIIPGATGQNHTAIVNGDYKVRASEAGCDNGVFSNTIDITTVGINASFSENITIVPNPSHGFITISNSIPGTQVSVIDIFGKELINEVIINAQQTLDMSAFNNGVYFVRISNGNKVSTERLLLNK